MSSFSEMTDDELREAHDAAGTLLHQVPGPPGAQHGRLIRYRSDR